MDNSGTSTPGRPHFNHKRDCQRRYNELCTGLITTVSCTQRGDEIPAFSASRARQFSRGLVPWHEVSYV